MNSSSSRRRGLAQVLAALLLPGSAVAQSATASSPDTSANGEQAVQLPAFDVTGDPADVYRATTATAASRVTADVTDIPNSVSVLTPQFIQDVDPTRIFDATKYVAGISEGQGDGFLDRLYIRGFQNNGNTVDNFTSIQIENADPLFIDHIEVVKGPSAILAPTGTPGGMIDIISKYPSYQASNEVSLDLGLHDAQVLSADLTGPLPNAPAIAYRVLVGYKDSELNISEARSRRKLLGLSLSDAISDHTLLIVRGSYEDRWQFVYLPQIIDPNFSVNGADARLAPGFNYDSLDGTEPWAHRGGQYMEWDAVLTTAIGDHISVRAAVKGQRSVQQDMDMYAIVPSLANRYNPYTGQETPNDTWALGPGGTYLPTYSAYFDPTNLVEQPSLTDGQTDDFGAQVDIAAKYAFAGVTSSTVAGISLRWDTANQQFQTAPTLSFNLLQPVYGATPDFTGVFYEDTANDETYEEYVTEQLGFLGDRLLLDAGAVGVQADQTSSSNGVVGEPLDSGKVLGLFGIVVKPLPNLSLYASHSENAVPETVNNSPLWQEGQQYEFGGKMTFFKERLSITADHFQIAQTNMSVANPQFQEDPLHQPEDLLSDVKEHGEELEVMGGITRELSIVGSVTWLHQRDSLGRPVIMVPNNIAGALLDYRVRTGFLHGLDAFVGTSYQGRRSGEIPTVDFTPLNVITQPSFFLAPVETWNLGGRYKRGRMAYELNVDNLFDKHYIMLSSARFLGNIGEPLNVRLTTTYSF